MRRTRRDSNLRALFLCVLSVVGTSGCNSEIPIYDFKVAATYPHDEKAYSQGLLYSDGALYESTGRRGTSTVRRVDLETGRVQGSVPLPVSLFGEGLALHDGELFQLTWHAGIVHVFDLETLEVLRQHHYEGEGWGLTSNGEHLIMSDGTDVLQFRDPTTFAEVRRIHVRYDGDRRLPDLNELEYIEGEIWANVWKKDYLVRIDPKDGKVVGWVDLEGLFDTSKLDDDEAVLNGIAWDPAGKRVFVTGKLWPKVFEIELVPR